jgi:hypothetical protein
MKRTGEIESTFLTGVSTVPQQIHKYVLPHVEVDADNNITIEMPKYAIVLSALNQGETLAVYAKVRTEQTKTEKRTFHVAGTGHDLPEDLGNWTFVGTASSQFSPKICHIYVRNS